MSSDHRLKRLRQLIAQLERLPPSAERERMLREVRARVVDVDTGIAPTTLLAGYAESALAADARLPGRQAPRGVTPAPAAEDRPPRPAAPPELARAAYDEAEVAAGGSFARREDESFAGAGDQLSLAADDRRSHAAGDRPSPAADDRLSLAADDVLSLDDSAPFWPADAPAHRAAAPWTRGLRG